MNELDTSFAELLGRQPTDAERQDLYRVRDALGLKNNDAIWLVIMALQHYQTLYEKIPASIAEAAKEMNTEVKAAATKEANAAMKKAEAQLMTAVASSANKVARQVAGKVKIQWIVVCVAVVTTCLGATGWYAFQAGEKYGWGQGYQKMEVEEAVAQWALTPEGQEAYELAQAGADMKVLARCTRKGWYKKSFENGTACIPGTDKDGTIRGWRIP